MEDYKDCKTCSHEHTCDAMLARWCRERTEEGDWEIMRLAMEMYPLRNDTLEADTDQGGNTDSEWGVREWN